MSIEIDIATYHGGCVARSPSWSFGGVVDVNAGQKVVCLYSCFLLARQQGWNRACEKKMYFDDADEQYWAQKLDVMVYDEVLVAARVFVYRRCHRDFLIKVAGDRQLGRSLDSTGLAGAPLFPSRAAPLPLAFESRPQIATAQCTSLLSTHVVAGYTRAVAAEYYTVVSAHTLIILSKPRDSRSDYRLQLHRNARPVSNSVPFRVGDTAI